MAKYVLSSNAIHACLIPKKSMAVVVSEDGYLRILDIQKVSLKNQIHCLACVKLEISLTSITATETQVVFATDYKCIQLKLITELMKI